MASASLAHRGTGLSEDHTAVPTTDPSDTTSLLLERLQAYKHACGYLEAWVVAHEKAEKAQAKEYEKILKTVSSPLREGSHFEQQLGGIAGLFENIRSNTQGVANAHIENEKNIKSSVLPILERLHQEIKNKNSELSKGTAKGSKEVDKARQNTQKYIEALGQHSASFSSSGGKVDAANDPYLLQRGVHFRLHKQVLEENGNRQDLIAVQDSFATFEAHILEAFQQALSTFLQYQSGLMEREKSMYADITGTAQRIPKDFEFRSFIKRNSELLIDPSAPPRKANEIPFANQNHASTQPLIAGSLQRKSRVALKGYDTGYYVVTPSKYLHQFDDDDNTRKDPSPEISLYLPDCTVGGVNGEKFSIKGKDASKGKVGSALATSSEFSFKAHSAADAEKWYAIISEAAKGGAVGSATASPISPSGAGAAALPATSAGQAHGHQTGTVQAVPAQSVPTHAAPSTGQAPAAGQPAPAQSQQQPTGYQAAPITPGAGVTPGSAGPAKVDTGVAGLSAGSVPNSGVQKPAGQF